MYLKHLRLFIIIFSNWFHYTLQAATNTDVGKASDSSLCNEEEIWAPILENWITSNHREGRVTQVIPIQSMYGNGDNTTNEVRDEKQSKISSNTKIVNSNNGMKVIPPRQITETDMYLLSAIEKLVYRADFMEKRLKRVEEMLYYVMAGNKIDEEPCPDNFYRIGLNCYLFAGTAGRELDWKAANKQCKKHGSVLAEMETIEENQDLIAYIQTQPHLRGRDFWTGGLNPGLLWIWSNSARPVKTPGSSNNKDASNSIIGKGRCLQLAYNPPLRSYAYKGIDCGVRFSYVCEILENNSQNELRSLGKSLAILP